MSFADHGGLSHRVFANNPLVVVLRRRIQIVVVPVLRAGQHGFVLRK